jgi:endonuclease/exonuclease/phosphatase family metal-dependent hydrolase
MKITAFAAAAGLLGFAALTVAQPRVVEDDAAVKALEAEVASMDVMRRFGVPEAPAKADGAVRIATYNVANLFDDRDDPALAGDQDDADMTKPLHERVAVARAIRAIDADVLALQEVESLEALLWFRDRFLAGMGYEHVAALDAGDGRGIEQAVLSRRPITHTEVKPGLPLGGVHPEKYGTQENWHAGQPLLIRRSPLRADIELPGGTVTLFVVHHKSGRYSGYWREAESKAVLAMAEAVMEEYPERGVLILGDFNATPSDASVKTYLDAGFHDIFAERGSGDRFVTHESGRRIDLILANDAAVAQLDAEQAFVLGTAARPKEINWRDLPTFTGMASDHYPVVVDWVPAEPSRPEPAGGG